MITLKAKLLYHLKSVLNSYAIIFFSQNKILGLLLLMVTLFNPLSGMAGLFCVCISLALSNQTGISLNFTHKGLYSFNPLIFGLALGMFYQLNAAFLLWLVTGCLITLLFTFMLSLSFARDNLPVLALPFIITYWLIMLADAHNNGIGLIMQDGKLANEFSLNNAGHYTNHFADFAVSGFFYYADLFFRALSAILFQNNALAGLLVAVGILIHSRINFSLMIIGFISACLFHSIFFLSPDDTGYYNLGANFMMTAAAIGGFFIIPTWKSYCLAILSIPVTGLLVNAFSRLLGIYNLPLLSFPFCLIVLLLLYLLRLQITRGLQLTPVQNYSPEKNLYLYLANLNRVGDLNFLNVQLPFLGAWTVSQGYNGEITHKGEWAQALDFVIKDENDKTYHKYGAKAEDYYCFNKPVLACADGVIINVTDDVDDNEPGKVNMQQNWGNTIVIAHADSLYSKVSHLKKNSVKVKPGDVVSEGAVLALCGSSGRSPEPHLHFQIQKTPFIGSKTLRYPIANFNTLNAGNTAVNCAFTVPEEGDVVSRPSVSSSLRQAFLFEPGYIAEVRSGIGQKETWEVLKDGYAGTYLFCLQTLSSAYFISSDTAIYFIAFYGSEQSLLHDFYLAAYHISFNKDIPTLTDRFPLRTKNISSWIQDMAAPFCVYNSENYQSYHKSEKDQIRISSKGEREARSRKDMLFRASITVKDNQLKGFFIDKGATRVEVEWIN